MELDLDPMTKPHSTPSYQTISEPDTLNTHLESSNELPKDQDLIDWLNFNLISNVERYKLLNILRKNYLSFQRIVENEMQKLDGSFLLPVKRKITNDSILTTPPNEAISVFNSLDILAEASTKTSKKQRRFGDISFADKICELSSREQQLPSNIQLTRHS